MDSLLIIIVIALLVVNIGFILILVKRKQPEPTNNEQALKDEVSSLRNSFSESFGSMSKEIAKDMTAALTKVDEKVGNFNMQVEGLSKSSENFTRILSGVKQYGVLAEFSLASLLKDLLPASQFIANVKMKPEETSETVEFAIKLPGRNVNDSPVFLPIDAKFPQEDYARLQTAYEAGDSVAVEKSMKALLLAIKKFAKDIANKYIDPPNTTDFGIMFLPTEGLFAEVIRQPDMITFLQREYKIVITGPTTLAAMLNSLQMGFKTLAIQKRSSEVWNVLASVKKEFNTFGGVLEKAQKKINEANNEIENLVGTRTRMMQSKLKNVEQLELPADDSEKNTLLDYSEDEI